MTTAARAKTWLPWLALALALFAVVACGPNEKPQRHGEPKPTQDSFELGLWTTVSAEGGASLALDGSRLYVASWHHMVVWAGDRKQFALDSPAPAPGPLRIVDERVYWGPGWVEDGRYVPVDSLIPTELLPRVPDGPYRRVVTHAWAPDGSRVVIVTDTDKTASVDLYAGIDTEHVATLSTDPIPPRSVWVGSQRIIVGTTPLLMFDTDGRPETSIERWLERTRTHRCER